jgi:uncharacterized protein YlxW (UPF0749 family)
MIDQNGCDVDGFGIAFGDSLLAEISNLNEQIKDLQDQLAIEAKSNVRAGWSGILGPALSGVIVILKDELEKSSGLLKASHS